jgi:SAM-dependent methyltransferase
MPAPSSVSTPETGVPRRGWRVPTVASLRDRFYPDVVARDPVATFVRRLEARLRPGDAVLDLGAGAGRLSGYAFRGRVRRMVGVDLDPRVVANPLLDAGLRADICRLPFRSGSFDAAFSIYVLEHVDDPAALVSEVFRVLRPGGVYLALTPNILHYVTLLSRLSPPAFHRWINERRGRPSADTFPPLYRMNSRAALVRHFTGAGFETESIETIEVQPNYLTATALTFALGVAYERLVNAADLMSPFRVNLVAAFRKPVTRGPRPS